MLHFCCRKNASTQVDLSLLMIIHLKQNYEVQKNITLYYHNSLLVPGYGTNRLTAEANTPLFKAEKVVIQ